MPLYRSTSLVVACILLIQAAKTVTAQGKQSEDDRTDAKAGITQGSGISSVGTDKPVIVIAGLCDRNTPTTSSGCKTIITRGEFEKVITAIQPDMPRHARRAFALTYADALVMVQKAEQMGLDRGANFEEQMQLARIDILTRALRNEVQARASQISEEEIEAYYRDNRTMFEKAEVDRLYIPREKPSESVSASEINRVERRESAKELQEKSRSEADTLHASAVSGANFEVLQLQAYRNAGIQSTVPGTHMWIRSISLPPNQRVVMDMQPGDVSPILDDPNGYVIYKLVQKELLPLDEVHDQIKETLRSQRAQEQMRSITSSVTTTLNEEFFSR
jgi:hypothetical protein